MLGWTSPMQPLLESVASPVRPLTRQELSWVGSINFLGAVIGSLFWGALSDRLGRKKTGLLTAVPFCAGWAVMLAVPSYEWLLVGRILLGIGCCGVIINMPTFVTEVSQNHIRGRLGSFLMASLTAGTVFSYLVGMTQNYYVLTTVSLCVPVAFAILFFFLPESPVWLYVKGMKREAERSLSWYRSGDGEAVAEELHQLSLRSHLPRMRFSDLWKRRGTLRALLIGFGFVGGQQLCGMLGILTFAVSIFKEAGSGVTPHVSAVIVGLLQTVSCLVSTLLVDKAGRRLLLVTSFVTMAMALILLGWHLHLPDPSLSWIPVTCLSVHLVAYSLGAGPVPYIVLSEIFPPEARGSGMSVVQFIGTTFSFVGVKLFPDLMHLLGADGCFWFFGGCNVLAAFFVFVCVPETKGKPLNEVLSKLEGTSVNKKVIYENNASEKQPVELKLLPTRDEPL